MTGAVDLAMNKLEALILEISKSYPHKLKLPKSWHLGVYPPGEAQYVRHLDNYPEIEHKNRREITILLYLNENWSLEHNGGALRVYDTRTDPETWTDIAPIGGRCVVFFSKRVWHAVLPSREKHRYTVTLWVETLE